ncbi:MAG: UvrD-helicase domain-containing protein, partial [Lapillicoccus sp.]
MTDPQPRPGDAEALPSFSITDPLPVGTTLLEASAGTGKTWTIASLVTRYVAEGVCRLEEMLIVTFGRAASQELRQRVREQLVAAARVLGTPGDLDVVAAEADPRIQPLLDLLRNGEPTEVSRRLHRVREALADFDAATIATTHQFCHLVLASLGVAGDTDASAELVEDLDDLLVEVVSDLFVRDHGHAEPTAAPSRLTLATALAVARAAVSDPQARLEPADALPGSEARERV